MAKKTKKAGKDARKLKLVEQSGQQSDAVSRIWARKKRSAGAMTIMFKPKHSGAALKADISNMTLRNVPPYILRVLRKPRQLAELGELLDLLARRQTPLRRFLGVQATSPEVREPKKTFLRGSIPEITLVDLSRLLDPQVEPEEVTQPVPTSAGIDEEVLKEWNQTETSFWLVKDALTDEAIAQELAMDDLTAGIAELLLQGWVEMVQQGLYNAVNSDKSHKLYLSVLYLVLSNDFLPAGDWVKELAYRVDQEPAAAELFLKRLRAWAAGNKGRHALASLGWLIVRPDKPALVIAWDELIPHVRYRKYWKEGLTGEVLKRECDQLTIRVIPVAGRPYERTYQVTGHEAEGLEARDRVRYWENLNGRPFLLPEVPFSSYLLTKKKTWDRRDRYAYELDPISIG